MASRVPIFAPGFLGSEATLNHWLAAPGEHLYLGERVIELGLAGATCDVPTPQDGVLVERLAYPGDRVAAGQILGEIEAEES